MGASRTVLPEPTDEANRCDLGHVTPKTLQKALYVGFFGGGRPLQVVWLGWSQFPFPEAPLNMVRTRSTASVTSPSMNGTRWNASLASLEAGSGAECPRIPTEFHWDIV
jgi:hypothetical protein